MDSTPFHPNGRSIKKGISMEKGIVSADSTLIKGLEAALEWGGTKREISFLVVSAIALVVSFFAPDSLPFNPAWIAVVLCGAPIIIEAFIGLTTEFDIKADVLVSLALVASLIIGEYFAAGEVAVIMQLGALLEDLTVAKARSGIEKLVDLTPRTARRVTAVGEETIPADDVRENDVLRVLPGETVPADGVITAGQTSIDESVMTGESLPVDKASGDEVRSGTVNQFGAFEMRATRAGADSSIARMIELVKSADAGKAKIVRLADRWATWIVVTALLAAAGTWAVTGEVIRAVTILVVFCPCALVLATPTAIMAAIGNVTKYGVLVREGDALERLAGVKKIAFDKTGTLTFGKPKVVAVETLGGSRPEDDEASAGPADGSWGSIGADELIRLVGAAERLSEHPLGKAIAHRAQEQENGSAPPSVSGFEMTPGRGVAAIVDGRRIAAGNLEMMLEIGAHGADSANQAAQRHVDEGCTVVLVAIEGTCAGFVALADTVRPTAQAAIRSIKEISFDPVLLTGDHAQAAKHIAKTAGIEEVRSDCLPEDKLLAIEDYEMSGQPVCMVGDGVNDAPALKRATVGIAMGQTGSDIAVDAADIALVRDDIASLPHLLALSKRMLTTIRLNLTFSMTLNFVAIVLAMTGIMGPVVGALVHNAGSVVVIINSALLLSWKRRGQTNNAGAHGSTDQAL